MHFHELLSACSRKKGKAGFLDIILENRVGLGDIGSSQRTIESKEVEEGQLASAAEYTIWRSSQSGERSQAVQDAVGFSSMTNFCK